MEVNVRLLAGDKITCELLHQRARPTRVAASCVNSLRRRISSGVAVTTGYSRLRTRLTAPSISSFLSSCLLWRCCFNNRLVHGFTANLHNIAGGKNVAAHSLQQFCCRMSGALDSPQKLMVLVMLSNKTSFIGIINKLRIADSDAVLNFSIKFSAAARDLLKASHQPNLTRKRIYEENEKQEYGEDDDREDALSLEEIRK
ncbi:hypothetical protein EVAR_96661_1 [Eumeta japonica]|uniref:Uncharacterized protein n=1 Tax=Eumeta variegata TaxID=151549 RepID=A0A4C1SYY1_EUMVA|nr:hypothetical protein EVAR_96661_1 [Eumeta japonica]